MSSEEKAKFFYIDDFFIWLGCKFVTCDKDKPAEEPPKEEKKKEEKKPEPKPEKKEDDMR
jgi:hypothetical protein